MRPQWPDYNLLNQNHYQVMMLQLLEVINQFQISNFEIEVRFPTLSIANSFNSVVFFKD